MFFHTTFQSETIFSKTNFLSGCLVAPMNGFVLSSSYYSKKKLVALFAEKQTKPTSGRSFRFQFHFRFVSASGVSLPGGGRHVEWRLYRDSASPRRGAALHVRKQEHPWVQPHAALCVACCFSSVWCKDSVGIIEILSIALSP